MADREAAMAALGEPGWDLLLAAGSAFDDARGDALRSASLLASRRPAAAAARRAAALELVSEGARLGVKVGASDRLLAVRGAVEQATAGRVATWHAQQFDPSWRVVEIGCGCGGDSLAIAHRVRNLIACDTDPMRAACCHMNLAALGLSNARAVPGDGLEIADSEGAAADAVFADPDRRPDGVRTLDPEGWAPPLARLAALADAGRRVFVKAAPSLDADDAPPAFDVTYVSYAGECREAFLVSREDTAATRRVRAVLLPADAPSIVLEGARGDAPCGPVGASLYVPDPAAIRARLLAELCDRHGLALVDDGIAWLTGPAGAASPWLRERRVVERCDVADVPATLRRLGAGSLAVHVRGAPLDAAEAQRAWRKSIVAGGPAVDVFVSRFLGRPGVVLTRD